MIKRTVVVLVVLTSAAACIWLFTLTTSSSALTSFRYLDAIKETEQIPSNEDSPPTLTVPISLVVPCAAEDIALLSPLLTSVSRQKALPSETLIILNIGRSGEQEQVSILKFNQETADVEIPNGQEYYRDYLEDAERMESVIRKIPNLRIYLRSEAVYAGNNRAFGNREAQNEIVSFFDCDDYMLPDRMLALYQIFQEHSDLEALIHGYYATSASKWLSSIERIRQDDNPTDDLSLPWTFEQIQEVLPGKENDEPEFGWFFPKGMNKPGYPPLPPRSHNGWLTVKKKVLLEVPYPENVKRGQDSIYNWRLIKYKKNWNFTPLRLGIYVLHK